MKKSFFLSILAVGAVLAGCSKSEIVDSKYNDQAISFEKYLGRDAQTKAAVTTTANIADFGLYGFYTGAEKWSEETTPNLWNNVQVTKTNSWAPADKKYWTNESDFYSFLAYSPYPTVENGVVAIPGADPKVTYTVNTTIASQVDLLYANTPAVDGANGHIDMVKPTNNTVALNFQHALSRITVKASEANTDYSYTIYGLELSGKFVKTKTFDIEDGAWITSESDVNETASYFIKTVTTGENNALTDGVIVPDTTEEGKTAHDFAGENNYLMIIPVDLDATATEGDVTTYPDAATLKVTYTTTFDGHESTPMIKSVEVPTNFEQGMAYALNLVFAPNTTNEIKFSVTVDTWKDAESTVVPNNPENGK